MERDPREPDAARTALVVDDEPALARTMALNLRARGWNVVTAADGTAALRAATELATGDGSFDVVVLDLGLPDLDGIEVIRSLRSWSSVPILVLSARHDSTDKVTALDAGADDYVTKPFGMEELLARLRAAVRRGRSAGEAEEPVVVAGDLAIDLARRQVSRGGREVKLTPTEWALLEALVRRRGQLVPSRQLLAEVWGPGYRTETNYLRVYSAQLRRKLETDPSAPVHLITEPGMGYRFEV
ncbi:DNA-binding response OmpR family regulator [Friedmanniella endophytica]|uniref:DNA-binding response OmpR family regulator n=1 Tax=Microlunatus kandeliicorticis TaxID=1759536 RepID=A0A7W3P731_9ACTN|nr:response regulator transcription factor [Microlunatus kandeliicorticis]MBA8795676.1 DNA-binding response OmpR family regulator [Microlunatus kandeliicorticis]